MTRSFESDPQKLIKQNFGLSVSEFMEQLGRGEIDLDALKKAIAK